MGSLYWLGLRLRRGKVLQIIEIKKFGGASHHIQFAPLARLDSNNVAYGGPGNRPQQRNFEFIYSRFFQKYMPHFNFAN
jgi:hypothetical protein